MSVLEHLRGWPEPRRRDSIDAADVLLFDCWNVHSLEQLSRIEEAIQIEHIQIIVEIAFEVIAE